MAKKKSTKEKKTNDERILDQHHIEYEEVSFDWINNGADASNRHWPISKSATAMMIVRLSF